MCGMSPGQRITRASALPGCLCRPGLIFAVYPVLHPWYVCWIVPFLVIIPNRAWIFFSGAVFLSYLVLRGYVATGVWEEDPLVKLAQYLPFYGLLLYDGGRWLAQRSRHKNSLLFNNGHI